MAGLLRRPWAYTRGLYARGHAPVPEPDRASRVRAAHVSRRSLYRVHQTGIKSRVSFSFVTGGLSSDKTVYSNLVRDFREIRIASTEPKSFVLHIYFSSSSSKHTEFLFPIYILCTLLVLKYL
jgi:hypothetical protein